MHPGNFSCFSCPFSSLQLKSGLEKEGGYGNGESLQSPEDKIERPSKRARHSEDMAISRLDSDIHEEPKPGLEDRKNPAAHPKPAAEEPSFLAQLRKIAKPLLPQVSSDPYFLSLKLFEKMFESAGEIEFCLIR